MKRLICIFVVMLGVCLILQGCNSNNEVDVNNNISGNKEISTNDNAITKEMAYEGVNNYCHSNYDWSVAEENPSIMYVEMGEETENEYQVIFRSYTGAYEYFYVDKTNGTTRIKEYVPAFDVENEMGTFDLKEYLN